jgi:hypothetical protein
MTYRVTEQFISEDSGLRIQNACALGGICNWERGFLEKWLLQIRTQDLELRIENTWAALQMNDSEF